MGLGIVGMKHIINNKKGALKVRSLGCLLVLKHLYVES